MENIEALDRCLSDLQFALENIQKAHEDCTGLEHMVLLPIIGKIKKAHDQVKCLFLEVK